MTCDEAEHYLAMLCNACRMVRVHDALYYVDAADAVDVVHMRAGLPLLPRHVPRYAQYRDALAMRVCAAEVMHAGVMRSCAQRQYCTWAWLALASALQTLLLAYYTFCVYDWEVMEPVCYFVTTATSLCVLMYVTRCRCASSYCGIDEHCARMTLARTLPDSPRQLARWVKDVAQLVRVDAALRTRAHVRRDALLSMVRNAAAKRPASAHATQ